MVRKWVLRGIVAYLLFGLAIFMYLFYLADTSIPEELRGSAVDPATFLTEEEYKLSEEYSKIRNLLYFLAQPYEWLFYFFLLIFGLSGRFEQWSKQITKSFIGQIVIYIFWLSLFSFVVMLPLRFISYMFSKAYHISTQTFSAWMRDNFIDFWVEYMILVIVGIVLMMLIRKFNKRWWFAAWILLIPASFFFMYVQPVWIDPLYNEFYPLQDKELETKILSLAEEANIPAERVYEVNMSTKTNALNAYVTGVGSNSRIVLWDTTLERLTDEEILFIMAHEMAHYVEKHIYIGITGYLVLAFFALWLAARIMERWINRWGKYWKVKRESISALPVLLLVLNLILFAASPITNAVSRYQESRADAYAIQLTKDKEAGIKTFHNLTKAGLSQVNPPFLVKIFRYGHPTMLERIQMVEKFDGDASPLE